VHKHDVMKASGGHGGISPRILKSHIRRRWFTRCTRPGITVWWVSGLAAVFWMCWGREISLFLSGIKPWPCNPKSVTFLAERASLNILLKLWEQLNKCSRYLRLAFYTNVILYNDFHTYFRSVLQNHSLCWRNAVKVATFKQTKVRKRWPASPYRT
jgi:hypothetical protein